MIAESLVEVKSVNKTFWQKKQRIAVLKDINLTIHTGEILALVGESGTGKSTLARTVMLLYRPDSGQIVFQGKDVTRARRRSMAEYRQQVQMVFQDPFSSLNPAHTVKTIMKRALPRSHKISTHDVDELFEKHLAQVGLTPARNFLRQYPHELSGGQRQRVAFARALLRQPRLVITDEPVSMLDVSLRLGLLNLMMDINQKTGVAYLYITHDLASARYIGARIVVMYAGQIVEIGSGDEVVDDPLHPYTQLLIQSAPDPNRPTVTYTGNDSPVKMDATATMPTTSQGCPFQMHCPLVKEVCRETAPRLVNISEARFVRCHRYDSTVSY